MKKLLKVVVYLILFVVVIFSAAIATLYFLPNSFYQNQIVKAADKAGFMVDFNSPLEITRSLKPEVILNNVTVVSHAAENPKQPETTKVDLSIDNLHTGIDLTKLMQKQISITQLTGNDIDATIELFDSPKPTTEPKAEKKDLKSIIQAANKMIDLNNIRVNNTHVLIKQSANINADIVATEEDNTAASGTKNIDIVVDSFSCNTEQCNDAVSVKGNVNEIDYAINLKSWPNKDAPEVFAYELNANVGQSHVAVLTNFDTRSVEIPLEADIQGDIPLINEWLKILDIDIPDIGPLNISTKLAGSLQGDDTDFSLSDILIDLDDELIDFETKGSVGSLKNQSGIDLTTNLEVESLNSLLALWKPIPGIDGNAYANIELKSSDKGAALTINALNATVNESEISAEGNIPDIFELIKNKGLNDSNGSITLNLNAPDLSMVNQFMPDDSIKMPPEWGPITGKLDVITNDKGVHLSEIDINMTGNTTANISGTIPLLNLHESEINLKASLATLKEINAFIPGSYKLPDIGAINANGKLVFHKDSFLPSLLDVVGSYDDAYGTIDISGVIGNLFKFKEVDLDFKGNINSIRIAEEFYNADFKLPNIKNITASGKFKSKPRPNDEKKLELDLLNISANIEDNENGVKALAKGEITNLISEKANFNLTTSMDANNLKFIEGLTKTKVPDLGALSANIDILGNVTKGFDINFSQGKLKGQNLNADVDGNFTTRKDTQSAYGLNISANTPNIQKLLAQLDIKSPMAKPLAVSLSIQPVKGGFKFTKVTAQSEENKLAGNITLITENNKKVPDINGEIDIQKLDLVRLLDLKIKKDNPAPKEKKPWFDDTPLFTTFFKDITANLVINITDMVTPLAHITNTKANFKSNKGVLEIGPIKANAAGGVISAHVKSNLSINPSITSIKFDIDNIDPKKITLLENEDFIKPDGRLSVLLDINGEGDTMSSFVSHANGKYLVQFNNINIKSAGLKVIGSDFIFDLLNRLNPFAETSSYVNFDCGVINYDIVDGNAKAKNGIVAASESFAILGDSTVNLATEDINMHFETKAKKGLGISIGSTFAGIVKVGGKLYDRKIQLSGEGLLKTGASLGAAFFTAGATVVAEGLWNKFIANDDLCKSALEGK